MHELRELRSVGVPERVPHAGVLPHREPGEGHPLRESFHREPGEVHAELVHARPQRLPALRREVGEGPGAPESVAQVGEPLLRVAPLVERLPQLVRDRIEPHVRGDWCCGHVLVTLSG